MNFDGTIWKVSFQKIKKSLKSDQRNSATEKVPEALISPKIVIREGRIVEYLSTAITLVPFIQFQNFYDFLKA